MYLVVKRYLDILFSILVLIVLSPVYLLTSLAIKLESPGPVIFKQERLGLNGRVFKVFKFRSMVTGAEKMGSGQYSFKGDPRVTKVGHLIRLTSIDELPQLFNILLGDMSWIGPRPPLVYHPCRYEDYSEQDKRRFTVRPGITGWAQINGRKEIDWKKRIAYDLEYVDRVSWRFDLKIALTTVGKLLTMSDNVNIDKTV
ncbi:MAG: sugar transferase [Eubacteriales bacterium]|nr:sugar transferase [Eubacteriales bacterium]